MRRCAAATPSADEQIECILEYSTHFNDCQPCSSPIGLPAGKPLFGTLIALLYKGRPVLGIIDQPVLRERWQGVAGQPSTLNGAPIRTRQCPELRLAYLYATTPHMFSGERGPRCTYLPFQVTFVLAYLSPSFMQARPRPPSTGSEMQ